MTREDADKMAMVSRACQKLYDADYGIAGFNNNCIVAEGNVVSAPEVHLSERKFDELVEALGVEPVFGYMNGTMESWHFQYKEVYFMCLRHTKSEEVVSNE